MVNIIEFFKSKKREKPDGSHDFNDNDRQKAYITRQANKLRKAKLEILNTKLKDLRQKMEEEALREQINSIENDLYGEEEEAEEDEEPESFEEKIGLKFVEHLLSGKKGSYPLPNYPEAEHFDGIDSLPPMPPPPQPKESKLNEKEIRGILERLPFAAKAYIKHCDMPTLERMIQLIKEGK